MARICRVRVACLAAVGAVALVVAVAANTSHAAVQPPPGITPQQVRKAIDDGVAFLKRSQRKADGSWGEYQTQAGGMTALVTLALLTAGTPVDDPAIEAALRYLERIHPKTTYATALQTLVFCHAKPKQYLARIKENVVNLERWQIKDGPFSGAWSYPGAGGDNSNSQFALLALHEAERVGVSVRHETWARAKTYWEEGQNFDGSWGYHSHTEGTGSMTCAGIAALIICADKFMQPNARVNGDQIECCLKNEAAESDRIQRAAVWLGNNFSVTTNPGSPGQLWLLYYLYGLERVGRLTNQRFFYSGKHEAHDWYREGSEFLVRRYDPLKSYWVGVGHAEMDPVVGTSFALLFLAKGRRPVLMAKAQHSVEGDWNAHRSDVDNMTRYVESQWKRDLTWQTVDLFKASVEDLLQSPVLFFSGNLNPLPADAAAKKSLALKLRDYLDRGGFLFAEANCGGTGFDKGFRELMTLVFPEKEYSLRLLDPDHPIWRAEEQVSAEQMRTLLGVDFGCRTSVVYAPPEPAANPRPSLSCLWELSRPGREQNYSRKVRDEIDGGLAIGINVLAYATNREVEGKEEQFRRIAKRPADASEMERGKLRVAKLRHPGGCNAAPRALANLLEAAEQSLKIPSDEETPLIDITDERLYDYPIVFMHGRNAFRFTEVERKRLKTYVDRGGVIFADAICTSTAFGETFRREMAAIFPEQKLQRIPADDPLLTAAYGGFDLKKVQRREPSRATEGPITTVTRDVPPDLEGINIDGRWVVIFSQYDISCALEKRDSMECRGYTRKDAARIGLNILLYALQQ